MSHETVSIIIAVISLLGTVLIAAFNVRSAQMNASDKIAIGSAKLIDEIQDARKRDKETILGLEKRLDDFEKWKKLVEDYLVVCWNGAKENEKFITDLGMTPPYVMPDLPFMGEQKNE